MLSGFPAFRLSSGAFTRPRRPFRTLRSGPGAAATRGPLRLPRQREMRRGGPSFAPERLPHGTRSPARRFGSPPGLRPIAGGLLPRSRRSAARGREIDAGAARFRQADRDRLLGRCGPVLAFAHVMHLLAHEFAGLRRGRLAFTLVALGALECFSFGHTYLHEKTDAGCVPRERGNRVCQLPITVPTIGRGAGESDGAKSISA